MITKRRMNLSFKFYRLTKDNIVPTSSNSINVLSSFPPFRALYFLEVMTRWQISANAIYSMMIKKEKPLYNQSALKPSVEAPFLSHPACTSTLATRGTRYCSQRERESRYERKMKRKGNLIRLSTIFTLIP